MRYKFIGKSIFMPDEKILVITDLHIGYEEALNSKGFLFPRSQYKKTKEDFKKIFDEVGNVKEIVILGDLKHEFGKISKQEWRETLDLIDFLEEKVKKIVLVEGNHDKILGPLVKKKNLEVKKFYISGKNGFLHGHKCYPEVLDKKIKKLFLGHLHPAISIKKGPKQETYKCFLEGKWKGKDILILPSFFPLVEGSDVFGEKIEYTHLDFNFDLEKFKVHIPIEGENKVLDFVKVKDIGNLI